MKSPLRRPASRQQTSRVQPERKESNGARLPKESVRLGAIDIGSNSIRQIIADVTRDGRIRVIDELKAAPRLGSGVDANGIMGDESIQQALEALHRMKDLARKYQVAALDVIATNAVRDAVNGRGFVDLVRRECGLRIRVLRGDAEARLAFRSALAHFDLAGTRAVVMDVGGGSLELAMSADGLIDRLASFPFGAIRMTEQFLGDRPSAKDVKRLRKFVRDDIRKALPLRDWRGSQLICSGGTFTNLAGMYLYRQGVKNAAGRVHSTRVPREEVEHIVDLLQATPPEERGAIRGLNPGRADIILAGLAVAAEVMARIEARDLVVSGYGIREGILLERAKVRTTPADPGAARERSVRTFAERCHYEERHARHVQMLALQIFDAVGNRLDLTSADRRILADAALLHDVGYHINYDQHHKHSYHLILHAELLGMTPAEQVMVANVARYHRGARPKLKHENFAVLDSFTQRRVESMSAILRVADGLDRGHVGAVARARIRWSERALRITVEPDARARSLRLELWGATRKAELLGMVCERKVEIGARSLT